MTGLEAERELLRICVRRCLPDDGGSEGPEPFLARVNWDHVLWLGRQQKTLLFVNAALKVPELSGRCPTEVIRQLAALSEACKMRALARGHEICLTQDLFDRQAMPAMPVDQWTFLHCCNGRPDLAELSTTLKYLVPAGDRVRAEAALTEAGHACKSDPSKLVKRNMSPVILNDGLGACADAGRLWAQAGAFTLGGRSLRRLSPVHWLLHRMIGHEAMSIPSLRRAWGVAMLVRSHPDWDWREVKAEAAHFGLENIVLAQVAACHRALGIPAPAGIVGHLGARDGLPGRTGGTPVPRSDKTQPLPSIPYLPTPPRIVGRMLEFAKLGPDDVVYDLGCGDGRIVVQAAKQFGARGVGIDLDPVRIAEANANAAAQGVTDRVTFICGDLFKASLAEPTVLFLYLLPACYPPLRRKLGQDAKPGLRIVSHDYVFPGWPPEKTELIRTDPFRVPQIFLWRLP